jgi:hypothetical protein
MSNVIPSILKQISKTTAAAGLAVSLLTGGVAVASEPTVQERAEAAMMQGKDYSAAWADATRALGPSSSKELAGRIIRSESQMNEGKDYVAARDVPSNVYAPDQVAKAQRVEDAMNQGKDYVAAWAASATEQPVTVSASRTGGTTMAGGRAQTGK